MPMGVHIASGERRDATAVSAAGAKPGADTCHIRPVTCRPGRDAGPGTGHRPGPAHIAVIAQVGVQRLFLRGEGAGQRESRLAVDVLVVPREQELDRDGDPSRRLCQGLVHDKPSSEDRGGDPGVRSPSAVSRSRCPALSVRRFGAGLMQFLEGIQGRLPFRHGTLRKCDRALRVISPRSASEVP
jgi:hypothetical protein